MEEDKETRRQQVAQRRDPLMPYQALKQFNAAAASYGVGYIDGADGQRPCSVSTSYAECSKLTDSCMHSF